MNAAELVARVDARLGPAVAPADGPNAVWSPASVAFALAIVRFGATGSVADRLDDLFGTNGVNLDGLAAACAQLAATIESVAPGAVADADRTVSLERAAALWPASDVTLAARFLALVEVAGVTQLHPLDFAAGPGEAQATINAWVSAVTKGAITDLVPDGVLDVDTTFVLTDAVHLDAAWELPFRPDERALPFATADGREVTPDMLSRRGTWPYAETESTRAVSVPYAGGRLVATVLLSTPGAQDEPSAPGDADAEVLAALANTPAVPVDLTMPAVRLDHRVEMARVLTDRGLAGVLGARLDDAVEDPSVPIEVGALLHRATLAVDAEGTVAAAATAAVTRAGSIAPAQRPHTMLVDRPYRLRIHDTRSGLQLFAAHITDPTAA